MQTVDVFSPSVDDPYQFGRIAAANSLSDIYAMVAALTALSIIGFPGYTLPESVLHEILRGGIDAMAEAGVAVLGGHTIQDKEIKAGFAVTGIVHPQKIVTNAGARPGIGWSSPSPWARASWPSPPRSAVRRRKPSRPRRFPWLS